MSCTMRLIASQRAKNAALSRTRGLADVEVDVAVADMAERHRPRAGHGGNHGARCLLDEARDR